MECPSSDVATTDGAKRAQSDYVVVRFGKTWGMGGAEPITGRRINCAPIWRPLGILSLEMGNMVDQDKKTLVMDGARSLAV